MTGLPAQHTAAVNLTVLRSRVASRLPVASPSSASGTHEERLGVFEAYIDAADQIAQFEVADLDGEADRDSLLSQMVVGQVLFGQLLATLSRLAEEHHSTARLGGSNSDD